MTQPVTDLDRAYAAVEALRSPWPAPRDDFDKGFRRGLDTGLRAAMEIMERIRDEVAGADS